MSINKLEDLRKRRAVIEAGGGEKRIEKQHKNGKLTARERIALLFDEGTFVELDAFVKHRCTNFGMEKLEAPAEGVVTGYGQVEGRLVYAYAQDFTVVGGSLGEMHAAKICKVMDNALKVGAPVVGLNDSGGARIQEAVDALSGYGKIFYKNTLASGVIPQITAIMGPCAGGAVYSPALTDFIFMVDKTSQMFITGPQTSGVAQYIASNDEECIAEIRRLLSFLPSNNMETAPVYDTADDVNKIVEELNSIIPDNSNKPYDMKDVIRAIVDDADFFEYQPYFAQNILTGFARIGGKSVGIIANQPKV
ncbi:Propionyl-CoA carboxylase beta chain, partial [Aduncisulcus paluster]